MIVNSHHIPKQKLASNYLWKTHTQFVSHILSEFLVFPAMPTTQQESPVRTHEHWSLSKTALGGGLRPWTNSNKVNEYILWVY